MPDGAALALLAAGLGVGVVSGLTPVLPAEAYVVAVALTHDRALAVAVAAAVAVGQTAGKVVVFSAVRGAGRSRWLGRLRARSGGVGAPLTDVPAGPGATRSGDRPARAWRRAVARARTWLTRASAVCLAALQSRAGWAVVLLSAATGLPPLLAVTLVAGASSMRRTTFAATCLLGRTALFVVVAAVPGAFRSLLGA